MIFKWLRRWTHREPVPPWEPGSYLASIKQSRFDQNINQPNPAFAHGRCDIRQTWQPKTVALIWGHESHAIAFMMILALLINTCYKYGHRTSSLTSPWRQLKPSISWDYQHLIRLQAFPALVLVFKTTWLPNISNFHCRSYACYHANGARVCETERAFCDRSKNSSKTYILGFARNRQNMTYWHFSFKKLAMSPCCCFSFHSKINACYKMHVLIGY